MGEAALCLQQVQVMLTKTNYFDFNSWERSQKIKKMTTMKFTTVLKDLEEELKLANKVVGTVDLIQKEKLFCVFFCRTMWKN